MFSVAQYSLALLLIAAVASNGLTEASNLRQERQLQEKGDYFAAMLARVNKERAAKGKSALCMNKKLQAAAQRHSDDMAKNNYMAHDGADGSTMSQRITQAGYEWESSAENVAAGQSDVESVMDSWMASQGHYENIMGEYTMFGTAYAYNADSEFKYYWTQDFATGSTEACDSDESTTVETVPPSTEVTTGSTTQETVQQSSTPAPTTPVPETEPPATVVPGTETPEVPATKGPVATPAATTPAPVATPVATTPVPVASPAPTTPAPVATIVPTPAVTPAATTAPPSTSQEDCKSNF